ncbi:hypothetical protein SAAL107622_10635 [Lacicoccus alkaliphilus]
MNDDYRMYCNEWAEKGVYGRKASGNENHNVSECVF